MQSSHATPRPRVDRGLRLGPRRSVRLRCQVVRERDFRLVARHVLDLSEEGMLVVADRPVLTGEPLVLAFLAPLTQRWIDAEAVVTRVVHGRRPGDPGPALGVAFEWLEAPARTLLREQLRWFRVA